MTDNSKWKMYDELIAGIPEGIRIRDVVVGIHWTTVLTDNDLAGMAGTVKAGFKTGIEDGLYTGMDLKEAAERARSWNFLEASVGMAAINTWYNSVDKMRALGLYEEGKSHAGQGDSVFSHPEESMKGKKVAVVGHFPFIERKLGDICDLTVLERNPREGHDIPDPACEYILEDQDYVYITGMTFTNKTLPRLLELTKNAQTVMVGPSVPVTPILFDYGIDHISGFYITEPEINRQIIAQSGRFQTFQTGVRVEYGRN